MKTKTVIFLGIVFGLVAPVAGLFFGLQVSVVIGSILSWPLLLWVIITGEFVGDWSLLSFLAAILLSVVSWTFVFYIIHKTITFFFIRQKKTPSDE